MNRGPVLIWKAGPDKVRNYFNRTWLAFTGRALDAELGNGWMEGVHPQDLSASLDAFKQAIEQLRPFQVEYRLQRHDGQYRWILEIGVPRFNPDGTFDDYIGSCIDIHERKLAEEAVLGVSRRLIEAQEQERAWIARELHDDICQQIALLAIELHHPKHFSDCGAEFESYIDNLRRRVLEIGTQVQAISHRLHSSKLEYLGLVAASKSFCQELAEQQSVHVNFVSHNVPQRLPRDISICLFRVLQEALNNAVKHSGVKHFDVKLLGLDNEIQLSVRDSGVAFDVEAALNKQGLGLISMRERVSLARGTISILSKPARGTEVNVRVPVSEAGDLSQARTGAA
jgi:PAS domain S-box-containing protein